MCCGKTNIIDKVSNIIEGYTNILIPNIDIEFMYNERLLVCNNCNEKSIIIKLKNNTFYKCDKCNCPLSAKLRATNETCPLNKW